MMPIPMSTSFERARFKKEKTLIDNEANKDARDVSLAVRLMLTLAEHFYNDA